MNVELSNGGEKDAMNVETVSKLPATAERRVCPPFALVIC